MGGSSKSKTASTTNNKTNNIQTESGFQIVDSAGASIVMTDHDAIELSFDAIEEISRDSFGFAGDVNKRSFAFASEAIESVENANERIETINNKAIGTIKDFAETLKTGDLKTTKTIYLAGAGLVGAVVVSAIVVSGISANNKKASK